MSSGLQSGVATQPSARQESGRKLLSMLGNLRQLAKGQPCQMHLPYCNNNPETTVGAHIRRANTAGIGQKPCDLAIVFACSNCHDVIDGRVMIPGLTKLELDQYILFGLCRTLAIVWRVLNAA